MNPLLRRLTVGLVACVALAGRAAAGPPPVAADDLDRTILPIPEPEAAPVAELDARKAVAPPRAQVRAPRGAPNVVLVLLDDFGFGQASAFGGGVHTPTLERLAQGGLRYTRFHVAALCSPTRAALLTGRNHHSCNAGAVMDVATAFPGYTGVRPRNITPLAEILRLNGYSTAAFGKCHEIPPWEVSPSGPTDRWPTRSGFDKFYGFLGGETNQWAPAVYDGMTRVETPDDPNYHLLVDMTDRAVDWVRQQQALTPDRPSFVYYAPGATHAPHHVPKAWSDRYRGRFDGGWDRYREETLARQKALGVVPADAKLAPKPEAVKDWDDLTADERKVFARQMEVFAGYGEMVDHEVGRLAAAVEELGRMDDTLILYIVGDNGASPEGGLDGLNNEAGFFNGVPEPLKDKLDGLDDLGGPSSYPHYAAGWAVAGNTPFRYGKQVASDFGGSRNPMVVHWPKGFRARGEVRTQFHHVIDVAPTILEAAGLPQPTLVNGATQHPIEGVSLAYTFDDPGAEPRRRTQYFEIGGNRGVYHDGWFAGTVHRAPWEAAPRAALADDRWELFHVDRDFSQADDLAAAHPAKLKELQDLFLAEAAKYHVLPIDDRSVERMDPAVAGRPDLMGGRTSLRLHPGGIGLAENAFINVKNRSHDVTAELTVPEAGADGVIAAQGGRFGGWSLYLKEGRPTFAYNWLGRERYTIAADEKLPPGEVTLRYEFQYDGGGRGAGGKGTLLVDGRKVAEGRIDRTIPNIISVDETANVGVDEETTVTEDYAERRNKFTGVIRAVTIELK
ncbi:arylsulfatase [Paludisphaera soli]|uniref:arylsulfatase n=1 Tax=Paludisphaera soli TaxID=2712865 RepID=UPI0013EDCE3A|nr:arylsulfatase [Paludisphaera soli]